MIIQLLQHVITKTSSFVIFFHAVFVSICLGLWYEPPYTQQSELWTGVIGSDVPWLECPACNALTWVISVTE